MRPRLWCAVLVAAAAAACGGGDSGPPAELATISPFVVRQGETDISFLAMGENMRPGGVFKVSGIGVVIADVEIDPDDPTKATARILVDFDAPFGLRDIEYYRSDAHLEPEDTLVGALRVIAPDPVVAEVAPAIVAQGAVGAVLTVTGEHFRDGATVDLGPGITVRNLAVTDENTLAVTVDVDLKAAMGPRGIGYAQPGAGGGAATQKPGILQVNAPVPIIVSVLPAAVKQGATSLRLTLTGDLFRSGGAVVLGSGLTTFSLSVNSDTEAVVTVDALIDAAIGPRDVTFTQPAVGGAVAGTLADGIEVHYPDPELEAVTPFTLTQGGEDVTLTITGKNFRDGATIEISGSGLDVGTLTIESDTEATVDVTIESDAGAGPRDVTFTQAGEGGGASVTGEGLIEIAYPDPKLTSIKPTSITQGASNVTLTLTGDNFRDGGTVRAGAGVTATDPKWISDTSFEVTLETTANAPFGKRDVVYTHPDDGGGASVTLEDALRIVAPAPAVTSLSPTTVKQGDTGVKLTLTGKNFRGGGKITIEGTGFTMGATTVGSATEATVNVTVADDAAITKRDVTFTQPAAGGSATATGSGLLAIEYPDPVLTKVEPSTVPRGGPGVKLRITGTGLRAGGTIETSSTDVTLSSEKFVSSTSYTVVAKADSDAELGPRDLTYTHAAVGGGKSDKLGNAFQVRPLVEPNQWSPGRSRFPIHIAGDGFDKDTTLSVSGTGVTVHATTFDSANALTAEISVASSAGIGSRDLTITLGDSSKTTYAGVLRIVPAPPQVNDLTPITFAQGATDVAVAIGGVDFADGDTLSATGDGLTIKSVKVNPSGGITATISVSKTAKISERDATVTHDEDNGGESGTLQGAFRVVAAAPKITSVAPAAAGRTGSGGPTREVPVTITGSAFATGATLSVSHATGSGVSVASGSERVLSDTSMRATLSITGAATTGLWNLKVTNPGSVGDSGTSGDQSFDVKSETTLVVNRVTPASGSPHGGEQVTVFGAGFGARAVVDFGAVRGIGTLVLDRNTITTTVPTPAKTSRTASTAVDVKVTNPSATSATLKSGYRYGRDDVPFKIVATYPAQGATGVPQTLVSTAVLLSGPADTTTAAFGTTQGTNCRWLESGGSLITKGARGFGPRRRWLVVTRTDGGNLAAKNKGLYVTEVPTALTTVGGTPLVPSRTPAFWSYDRYSFTISTTTSDTTAPTVSTIVPGDKSTGRDTTTAVVLTFSEPVDPQTITTANITLKQSTTTIPISLGVGAGLKTVTLTPAAELEASKTYTTTVGGSVKDFSGNAFSAKSYTFTTNDGTDKTAPAIDAVILERLSADMDGSGTYVDTKGTSGKAFDVYLPRGGWLVTVLYSDHGGAGIDESTFSAKASVAVGDDKANAELASRFDVTPTQATWTTPAAGFATGDDATFTFSIKDLATTPNASTATKITIDVFDSSASAKNGGDHHPFDERDTWVLRGDLDAYAATYSTSTSPKRQGAKTTIGSNGVLDLDESLRVVGLNSASMTAAARATVNGKRRSTNVIVRALFLERTRALLRERFGIDEDGTRFSDSVEIEFLLPGERGSLSSLPVYSTSNAFNSSKSFSEMSIGGTQKAESNAFSSTSALASAWYDVRNRREEANLNLGTGSVTGVYLLSMMKYNVNSTGYFKTKITSRLVSIHGGTPAGEHASDDDVLSGSFDRSASSNLTHNARYDTIMEAIELLALYTSTVVAHEIGHSVGLAATGAPKTGVFGGAHYKNTFTEATSTRPNTNGHLDSIGNDIMPAAIGFDSAAQSGADFARFSAMNMAYLRGRLGYDEGK